MARFHECADLARDCIRLAGLAQNAELREKLMEMARVSMAAAMQEEQAAPSLVPLDEEPPP